MIYSDYHLIDLLYLSLVDTLHLFVLSWHAVNYGWGWPNMGRNQCSLKPILTIFALTCISESL